VAETSFDILGIAAADLAHPGIPLAVSRAGGIGILDLEFVADDALVVRNFERLLSAATGRVGLRVGPDNVALASELIATAGERSLTIILSGPVSAFPELIRKCGVREQDFRLGEILDAAVADEAAAYCAGLVARGHEAGGWVGEDSSYILLQKLRGKLRVPVFMQGGIGIRSAAACRLAGAAGVVLDDTLLLMAESPLSPATQAELARLNGAESRLLGELIQHPCRVYARPTNPALKAAEEDNRNAEGGTLSVERWLAQTQSRIGWSADGSRLMPIGQGIGLAAGYRDSYRNIGRLVQALRRASLRQSDRAAELAFLDENGPLAKSHGTRFPLAQGPMTRVSDSPAFAVEVAKGGALPFLALALMRGPQVADMLAETKAKIGDLPWGVGMLGFVPHALREEQCVEIWKCKPSFALIAGGRPDQAAEFEKHGIPTYIHAPAPALLKMYLEQGARRFVFEGRECGGHVGPLASFPLWEQMIEVLLEHVPAGEEKKIHVLFAGGVHDAASGAVVAAMAAPLAERGMRVGCLMGTAYLFTQEIVSSGAIVEEFQAEALRCRRTMNLESGPGHASRCVDTKFAHDFYETRRRLIREGKSSEEIREVLEDLNLGRLRIASKGVNRDDTGRIIEMTREQQREHGMYMIGQVATLRHQVQTVENLHLDVTRGAQALLDEAVTERVLRAEDARPSDIAIIGIGITLPKSDSADDYWQIILNKTSIIREAPKDRWDTDLFYDANPKARDKVYSKWGGFLDEVPFDPMRFGIPPKSMKSIDPMQLLALETAARTLADAGYADGQFDRENASIILGASGGAGDLGVQYSLRSELPRFVENPSPDVWERLPEWTEESFAGTLLNVAAGRIANRLDFGGVNFTVDAACGSSLAAINLAVHELESGRSSLVLTGGFDTTQSVYSFSAFAKTQALSPRGQPKTFDQAADGIAISEGVAMIALKRLADAERDGDRIYAVIKSTAGSSDGRALGMTAPRTEGQVRALKRAYHKAGFSPATLGLVEAHGTGTAVGDRTEAQTIARALNENHAASKSVAIGSIKTLIGHTKASAGVSGLIKIALSLYHRVLPAHHGVENPIDAIADATSPVYLLKDARPWIADARHPRRAASSAFGFGGTNFHAVLEEYRNAGGASGANRWPSELFLFRAADLPALVREIEKLIPNVQAGSRVKPAELAAALARKAETQRNLPVALAIVAQDLRSLASDLAAVVAHLQGGTKPLPLTVKLGRNVPASSPAVAFLFPGQGAQYVNMGREAALYVPEVREALELADRVLAEDFRHPLSSMILPAAAFDPETEAAQAVALTDTRVAQPAIGALAIGYLRLAERLGIHAVAAAGHSYGEYVALKAAGVITAGDLLRLSAIRGRAMANAAKASEPGGMAAVQGRRERVQALIAGFPGVRVANHNAPEQSVISGPKDVVEKAAERLSAQGLRASLLPVSGAFHTELVAPAKAPLSAAIHDTTFSAPRFSVYSNSTGGVYPSQPEEMQALLDGHMLSSVEFVTEIEAMYAAGCRVFVELGPKGICSNMARQTLAGREVTAISLDANGGGLRGMLIGFAELFVAGVHFDAMGLFADREVAVVDLSRLPELSQPASLPRHTWMLSGGCARPIDDPVIRTGQKPALTKASAEHARAAIQARTEAEIRARMPQSAAQGPAVIAAAPAAMPQATPALTSEALVAYQRTMSQFLALQERVVQQFLTPAAGAMPATLPSMPLPQTMPALVPAAPQLQPVSAPVAAAPAPQPAAVSVAQAPVVAAAIEVKPLLLGIVAERTGYPAEMLGLEADLEADLGIDSIKRVEILGALQKALPATQSADLQNRMERFTKARSLQALLNELEGLPAAAAPVAAVPDVAVVAAVAVPAPAVVASVDYKSLLLGIVAERTGYPAEMLAMDADLEADLGIDSIKRVEILGAFQKALPAETAAQVQTKMERFTKAKSLQVILSALDALAPATAPAPAAAVADVKAEPIAAGVAPTDFQPLLLGVVAERTGYPSEMLALDADLEADLGIDSIKRVEILGAFQKTLPAELASQVQGRMERFTKARSLAALLEELNKVAAIAEADRARPVEAAPAVAEPAQEAPAEATGNLPRFVIKARPAPLATATAKLQGLALVLGRPCDIVAGLMQGLRKQGLTPVHISSVEKSALRDAIARARTEHGAVQAILHLHGLAAGDVSNLRGWRGLYHRDLLSLFHTLQVAGTDLEQARVIAASRLGGTFGRDAVGQGTAVAGGVTGILNCIRAEYPSSRVRTLDFDGQTDPQIVDLLLAELAAEDPEHEAGYIGLKRFSAATVEQPLSDSPFPSRVTPSGDWVLLATGGARGITAEIIEEMVQPGMRLVLLGRTAEPAAESASTAVHEDAGALRKALIAQHLAKGEKPRPVEIDRAVSGILVDREIRANLMRLRAAGAIVEYVVCDARNEEALGGVIDELYARHSRIDAVIHGAGVIEDKLLADKSPESFERVLSTKLDPAYVLMRKLRPESLKLLAFFTSVAGRYGNRGQSDYAAANEALNRLAWELHRRWINTRVVSVNWGPWDGGMATEGVKRAMRSRGMEPIPVAAGRRFFVDELTKGPRHDVELVAGAGPWALESTRVSMLSEAPETGKEQFPLVRRAPRVGLGGAVMLEQRLSLDDDPYLADHRIDGRPTLPPAMAIEYMAQFVAAGWPEWQVAEVRDLRVHGEVVVDHGAGHDLLLRAKAATHSEPGSQAVAVEIVDPLGKTAPPFRATVILTQVLPVAAVPSLPRVSGQALQAAEAYARHLSQGERFRSLRQATGFEGVNLEAEALSSSPASFLGTASGAQWLFDPVLLDASAQLAFLWAQLGRGRGSQTRRLSVRRYGAQPLSGAFTLLQRVRPAEDHGSLQFEAEFLDASGAVRLHVIEGECLMDAGLNRLAPSSPDFVGVASGPQNRA
jgi:acyl transferase domain-containing protein/NADP-dependent 3-hydroxy acid dehydrogenase YdfG